MLHVGVFEGKDLDFGELLAVDGILEVCLVVDFELLRHRDLILVLRWTVVTYHFKLRPNLPIGDPTSSTQPPC